MHKNLICLDIAGVTFAVQLPAPAWRPALAGRYAAFPGPSRAAWQVTVTHDPALAVVDSAWIRHDGPVTTYRVSDLAGRIDLEARRADVRIPSEARTASALERVIAYVCMQVLPREHAALWLHAAGIVRDGVGHVFFGASGAGKTTVAGLAAGYGQVLSDENVVVRLAASGPELLSTPFWGQSTPPALICRVNRRAPLRALYALAQAPAFDLARLGPAEAVMALLGTEKVATERAASADARLAVAARLVAHVSVYRLGFRPDRDLWDFLARAAPASDRPGRGPAEM